MHKKPFSLSDARNLMVHIYRQEVASTIVRAAPRYFAAIDGMVQHMAPTRADQDA